VRRRIPPPSGVPNGKTPQAAGFCFVNKLRRLTGRSSDWLKFKNPEAPAVKREAEEEWR
jgi:hypothetical protein